MLESINFTMSSHGTNTWKNQIPKLATLPQFESQEYTGINFIVLSPIYTRQDVRKWTKGDFLSVAGKSKFLVEHFLMGILSRSWSFHIRTWTRNAKLTRLMIFISFKIWHRYAPRNTTRNVTSFWISRYTQKVTSCSYQGDVLTHIDWALWIPL